MPTATSMLLDWTTVYTDSQSDVFLPSGSFRPAVGVVEFRAMAEVRGRVGNMLVIPAFQACVDPRNPDAATSIKLAGGDASGYANANGYFDFDSNMVAMPAGKLYYRPGLVVKVSSGTGAARVWATIQALL